MALLTAYLGACVRLDKSDAFPVAHPRATVAALQTLVDAGATLTLLPVRVGTNAIPTYYVQHPGSRGVMILFGGSGNEIEAPLKVLSGRTKNLGLDLVVFSYYEQSELIPSVTAVRASAHAVYAAVVASHPLQSKSVYLLGYSLGGWFALDLAASEAAQGLILVGAETTPGDVIRTTYEPWSRILSIRPDADVMQLDASLYAANVRIPTIVVTSLADQDVPASIGRALYKLLPSTTPKQLVVLQGTTHGRYFLDATLWERCSAFLHLPPL